MNRFYAAIQEGYWLRILEILVKILEKIVKNKNKNNMKVNATRC